MDFLHFYVNPLLPVARIDIVARNFCPQNFLHRIKESTLLELGEITNHRHSYPPSIRARATRPIFYGQIKIFLFWIIWKLIISDVIPG